MTQQSALKIQDQAPPETGHDARGGPALLVVLCLAQFMVALDATVVNVALPSITRSLGFAAGDAQWVVTSYLLCTGGLTLLGGRAADLWGRRRMALAGLVVFAVASLASGLAGDAVTLIVARGAQGIGAALLSPAGLSIITTTYTGARRTAALSTWGAVGAGGFAAGLLVGGMLTTWASWHWVFFINLPVAALAVVVIPLLAPPDTSQSGRRRGLRQLAPGGPLAITAGLVSLVYALSTSAGHGWAAPATVATLVAAVALIAVFAVVERTSPRAFVPRALWRNRSLLAGAGLMFAATAILAGTLLLTTFVLQQQLHASALRTGLDYLPFAVMIGLAAHLGPHILSRLGTRAAAGAGLLIVAGGEALLVAAPPHASYVRWLLPAFVVLGAGTGLVFVAASVTAMARVAPEHTGAASGLLATGHEIGGGLGVAVLTTIAATAGTDPAGLALAAGRHAGYLTAALAAAAFALLAAGLVPKIRPDGHHRIAIH